MLRSVVASVLLLGAATASAQEPAVLKRDGDQTHSLPVPQQLQDTAAEYGGKIELSTGSDWAMASYDSDLLGQAAQKFAEYSQVVGEQFCKAPVRPSEFSISLNANFEFVLGVDTGAEAMWVIDDLCKRLGLEE